MLKEECKCRANILPSLLAYSPEMRSTWGLRRFLVRADLLVVVLTAVGGIVLCEL